MPEGDTIFKVAAALRPVLVRQQVVAARGKAGGPPLGRLAGGSVTSVEPLGKHLVMRFDNGLALHTHLRMTGSWHRYAPGERWQRPPWQAVVVLETASNVVVCFNAPVVELVAERAVDLHPSLAALGPDVLSEEFDPEEAVRRLRERADIAIGEALMDQRALAGIGNVYKSEVLFLERVNPFVSVSALDHDVLECLVATAERLLRANVSTSIFERVTTNARMALAGAPLWVYGRTGRPCFRCRVRVESRLQCEQLRRTYWCSKCQANS